MLFKARMARDIRDGIEATYVRLDPWEVDLFRVAHPDFPHGPLVPGHWYGVAWPRKIAEQLSPAEAPEGEPSHFDGERVISYLRREIDRSRLARWEAGERFQVADLYRELTA